MSRRLNLEQYERKNQEDARAYIEHYMKISEVGANIQSWLVQNNMSETKLCQDLVTESGNNFMYLKSGISWVYPF